MVGVSGGKVPTDEGAQAQAEHEEANDDGGGFDIDAKAANKVRCQTI